MTTRFKKFIEDVRKYKKLHESRICRDGECSEIEEAKRICEEAGLTVSRKPRFGMSESRRELDEAKGINTNTRAFQTKVQQTIKDNFEDDDWIENLKSDVEVLIDRRTPTLFNAAYKYAEDGNLDAYYADVVKTMSDWFECSEDELEKYYKGNKVRMLDVYCHFCARAIEAIITGVKRYVK